MEFSTEILAHSLKTGRDNARTLLSGKRHHGGTLLAKKYENLTFTDDFMFCKIMEMHPELCKQLLELALGRKVGALITVNRQKPIDITPDGRGIRFDVYAEDEKNIIYDVEMQNVNVDSIQKRTRYTQGMIDLNLIERGSRFSDLNRSILIYICNFNLFPLIGRHRYTFLNLCREDPQIEFGDETEKIFLCAVGNADDVPGPLKTFLDYIATGIPGDLLTDTLYTKVKEAQSQEQWRNDYMMLLDFAAQEREEERIKILSSLVHDKILSVEDAAARAGVSEEIFLQKVAELAENKENET